jgi:hypothetical protein
MKSTLCPQEFSPQMNADDHRLEKEKRTARGNWED